jgi:hypothetical protein
MRLEPRDVLLLPGRKIVEAIDASALVQQSLANMTADESSATGDENFEHEMETEPKTASRLNRLRLPGRQAAAESVACSFGPLLTADDQRTGAGRAAAWVISATRLRCTTASLAA